MHHVIIAKFNLIENTNDGYPKYLMSPLQFCAALSPVSIIHFTLFFLRSKAARVLLRSTGVCILREILKKLREKKQVSDAGHKRGKVP